MRVLPYLLEELEDRETEEMSQFKRITAISPLLTGLLSVLIALEKVMQVLSQFKQITVTSHLPTKLI